jgi:hypothetical protein
MHATTLACSFFEALYAISPFFVLIVRYAAPQDKGINDYRWPIQHEASDHPRYQEEF